MTAGIIAAAEASLTSVRVYLPLAVGVAALLGFVRVERRAEHPLLPLTLFRSRQFSAANGVTLLLYAANSGALLLLVIELQTASGFSPLRAGTALLPITVVMLLLLASRFGELAQRVRPRPLMTVGPLVSATGLFLMTRLTAHSTYLGDVLPAVTVFGLGLAIFVAPLTASVLGAVPSSHAGIASGVNNAVARAAGLISIAALPVITGLTGDAYRSADGILGPFREAMWICFGLHVAGAVLSALTVRPVRHPESAHPATEASITLSGNQILPAHSHGPRAGGADRRRGKTDVRTR